MLPRLGQAIAGDADSYRYLAESIRTFPDQLALEAMMREAGLAAGAPPQPDRRHRGDPYRAPALKRVLLVVAGGIAAYKALELVRLLRKAGYGVTAVLTEGGAHFVTPLSLQALTETKVYTDLWSLTDESEMGHIQLSRAPPTSWWWRRPARISWPAWRPGGRTTWPPRCCWPPTSRCWLAPAMNVRMWLHPATVANAATLRSRGVLFVGPDEGVMACNEFGPGRLAEPPAILAAIEAFFGPKPLAGKHAARHQWPDARADRPGALHRQPLLRPPGHGDRGGAAGSSGRG